MKCPTCGKKMKRVKKDYRFTESGLDNVYLSSIEVYECSCGEKIAKIPYMQELLNKIGEAIVNRPGRMTGMEIRYLRKNAGFSSKTFAEYLHQTPETLSRWENGQRDPGGQSDLLIRLCYAALMNYENPKQIVEMFVNLRGKKKSKITMKPSPKHGYDIVYA